MGQKLTRLVILCAACALSFRALAACDSLLLPSYRLGQHVNLEADLQMESLVPESGSLESRHPGLARDVIRVMYKTAPFFSWTEARKIEDHDAVAIFHRLAQLEPGLLELAERYALQGHDRERLLDLCRILSEVLRATAQNFSPFATTEDKIFLFRGLTAWLQSSIFEFLFSLFFDGERFTLHADAKDHYLGARPQRIPLRALKATRKTHKGTREIDLIIRRRDGRELWIEVKNNSMEWTIAEYLNWAAESGVEPMDNIEHFHAAHEFSRSRSFRGDFQHQLREQRALRQELGLEKTVDLLLLTKHALPEDLRAEVNELGFATYSLYASPKPLLPYYFRNITSNSLP